MQLAPILVTTGFLIINILILYLILWLNWRTSDQPQLCSSTTSPQAEVTATPKPLNAADILGWEFEYARTTASEAMQDRHTMVNFYLLAVGVVASGMVVVLGREINLPAGTGTALLWLLCGIGWLYFLKLIRLRQSWHDSARAMNRIKDFYLRHNQDFEMDHLQEAFLWQSDTLPPPDRPWNVFFFSATLIGLLDSVAFIAGGALLFDLEAALAHPLPTSGLLAVLGLAFFTFHLRMYFEFLKPQPDGRTSG